MTVESGIALVIATFIFASIPGPGVSAMVVQSLARGFRTGASFAIGLACGDLVYLLLALLGMGWIAPKIGPWFMVIKWIGAAYIIYLGIQLWRSESPVAEDIQLQPQRRRRSFLGGLCVTLGNPKVIAFYCGFLPGFVDIPTLTSTDIVLVISLIIPTVLTVLLSYAWFAAKGQRIMRSARTWKITSRTAGTIMVGAGVAVAAD